jgi:hypothetical protein
MAVSGRFTLCDGAEGTEVLVIGFAAGLGEGEPCTGSFPDVSFPYLEVSGFFEEVGLSGQDGVSYLDAVADSTELGFVNGRQGSDDAEPHW